MGAKPLDGVSLKPLLLGDAGEAEEATQEVFLTLYRKAASFEPRGRLRR